MASRPPAVAAEAKAAARVGDSPSVTRTTWASSACQPSSASSISILTWAADGKSAPAAYAVVGEVEVVGLEEHAALAEVDRLGVDHGALEEHACGQADIGPLVRPPLVVLGDVGHEAPRRAYHEPHAG